MKLFEKNKTTQPIQDTYSAQDIEVLEGLEPVRRRPGMYIGGTDERALHHLVAEILDNAMDEAVAGHATRIELTMQEDGFVTISDNGRGIPTDPHPKDPTKSALEIIMTTLHAGGKFGGGAYQTSGGLHGVGISVVCALSDHLRVEIARDKTLWQQTYSKGKPTSKLEKIGAAPNRRGTTVHFSPDPEIFGDNCQFKPGNLYHMAKSKAYLYRGVEIRWTCHTLQKPEAIPEKEIIHFPNGLTDYLLHTLGKAETLTPVPFEGSITLDSDTGIEQRVEWAITWTPESQGFMHSYCNTVPTPLGGTHENGLRAALTRAIKSYGEIANVKKNSIITTDDVLGPACALLSIFIGEPQFQGQTKEKLVSAGAQKLVDTVIKDRFENWLSSNTAMANSLLDFFIACAEDRIARKKAKETQRKTATQRLRLPGKLADCSNTGREGTEIFLVEGDSAGGTAKQARQRAIQAILPLRGKILNVANASADKRMANQQLADLVLALGCGAGKDFDVQKLRYERVVIMTDADVDGAHIAALLMTFFYHQMPKLVTDGHLYLAAPPLYKLSNSGKTIYARDDDHKDKLIAKEFKKGAKIDITRFKGLGEMSSQQLKSTTMDPDTRTLLKVSLPLRAPHARTDEEDYHAQCTDDLVECLMGNKAEARYQFIQENATFTDNLDV